MVHVGHLRTPVIQDLQLDTVLEAVEEVQHGLVMGPMVDRVQAVVLRMGRVLPFNLQFVYHLQNKPIMDNGLLMMICVMDQMLLVQVFLDENTLLPRGIQLKI